MNTSTQNTEKILITGGTGFLGSALAGELTAKGAQVTILTRRPDAEFKGAKALGDLNDRTSLEQALVGISCVIHCAAEKSNASLMEEVNVRGTANLIAACKASTIKRFIHVSSVGVIGRVEDPLVNEDTPCRPMNPYEVTKERAERLFAEEKLPFPVCIVRPTNIFGPDTLRSRLLGSFPASFRRWLKGREHSHLVYLGDVTAAIIHLLGRSQLTNIETYIIADEERRAFTHAQVQGILHGLSPRVPSAPLFPAPMMLPYLLRRIRHSRSNCGNLT